MKIHIVIGFSLVLLYNFDSVHSALAREYASVTDPNLLKQGYSCQSKTPEIGPMKDGEVNLNYSPKICAKVSCSSGIITHESCSPFSTPGKVIPADPKKPFPECCLRPV